MPPSVSVLALFAHPDDAEFLCAGTLIHLARLDAKIHIATMTAGDCGSAILPPEKITSIRRKEARRAAAHINAEYSCLGEKDILIFYDGPTVKKVMELVRRVNPALVFTHSPSDYMLDHETTSKLAQSACFAAMAPNFRTGARRPAKAIRAIPHLYYTQPFGGRDILGKVIRPGVCVDIADTMERKATMLACHESQRAWLQTQQEVTKLDNPMLEMARKSGDLAGFHLAEGFRQHLGQGFPQRNLLKDLLGEVVRTVDP